MLLGSIEAGGTKFVCAVGDENFNEIDKKIIPTTTPEETLGASIEFFKQYAELAALSIASFGPIDTNPASEKYGYITDTPKVKWQNCNFVGTMTDALNIPVYWTTDVNGSVYGEYVNLKDKYDNPALVYYTLGTGVGAGAIQNGRFIGGISTPEMGHVRLQRHPADRSSCFLLGARQRLGYVDGLRTARRSTGRLSSTCESDGLFPGSCTWSDSLAKRRRTLAPIARPE